MSPPEVRKIRITQRITCVLGSAAEYVRLAPVAAALRRRLPHVRQVLVSTDEGRTESPVSLFEGELDVPDLSYVLGIGSARDPGHLAYTLDRFERVIELERPDFVLVAGDGDTALAGMLAAARRDVPVAQLDAGVDVVEHTSPAALTQRIADEIAALRFVPSEEAADRVLAHGVAAERVHLVGSTMIDALVGLEDRLDCADAVGREGLREGDYLLVALHGSALARRRTLWGILNELRYLSRERTVALVMHPDLERAIRSYPLCSRVRQIGPLDYLDSVSLAAKAAAVITDSIDVRTQAKHFGVQCLTPSESADRLATSIHGRDVDRDPTVIPIENVSLDAPRGLDRRSALGDGRASERVVDVFERALPSRPALRPVAFEEPRLSEEAGASSPADLRPA
jgi:UDP-N-acetylglucosamine 2-epimerase (non-hydrolysing)